MRLPRPSVVTPRRDGTPPRGGRRGRGVPSGLAVLGTLLLLVATAGVPTAQADTTAGEYLFHAGGCLTCHTAEGEEGVELAGGLVFDTPFGRFRSPNITPHPEDGIGRWSLEDFDRALRHGVAPDGSHYYPVFPYTSYTRMVSADVRDLFTYLQSREAVARPNEAHELPWYLRWRWLNALWKLVFFEPGEFRPDPARGETWNRGAYLSEALAHCGECHTPRGLLGAVDRDRHLAGNPEGPAGGSVPNLTPHPSSAVSGWSQSDLTWYLELGELPDGDYAGGAMAEVIDNGLRHLTGADRTAIAEYILSLPPLPTPP